jgi:arylsulfatase A-like enzyme
VPLILPVTFQHSRPHENAIGRIRSAILKLSPLIGMTSSRREFGSLIASAWALRTASAQKAPDRKERRPNIVILLADDLGYGDLGCYGNRVIRTPNIDRVASEGLRLTEFYATPTCTPSRAALLTGRYSLRSGLTRVLIPRENFGIPDSEITLAEALKTAGYSTACIGKWHLGDRLRHRPNRHGFDYFYGLLYSHDMTLPLVHWPPVRLFRNDTPIESPAKLPSLTQRLTQEAVDFIENNRDKPFLLYLPYTMPHLPWSASSGFAGKSEYGPYGDAVEEIDWSVGNVVECLSRHGLEKDTVVVFASDNGPELATPAPGGSTGGLRGGKGSAWEGGVRVPCIVRWPDRVPAGSVSSGLSCVMDLFATFTHLAGAHVPEEVAIDGLDLSEFLQGRYESPRTALCHFRNGRLFAVRDGPWKLHLMKVERGRKGGLKEPVICNPPELYNLNDDPQESRDLAAEYPGLAEQFEHLGQSYLRAIGAGERAPRHLRSLLTRGKRKP